MYPPLRWCSARTHHGIPCTSFLRKRGSKLFHSFTCARTRSSSLTTSFHLQTLPLIRSQTCSMGFILVLLLGLWRFSIPSCARKSVTIRMRTGIVVLKYGACCLMCSEMWIHNRPKNIVNVTLPSLSNNLEIKLVAMTKAASHHNGSATELFSFTNDPVHVDAIREHAQP